MMNWRYLVYRDGDEAGLGRIIFPLSLLNINRVRDGKEICLEIPRYFTHTHTKLIFNI